MISLFAHASGEQLWVLKANGSGYAQNASD